MKVTKKNEATQVTIKTSHRKEKNFTKGERRSYTSVRRKQVWRTSKREVRRDRPRSRRRGFEQREQLTSS